MLDVSVVRMLLMVVTGWLDGRQRDAIAYLVLCENPAEARLQKIAA